MCKLRRQISVPTAAIESKHKYTPPTNGKVVWAAPVHDPAVPDRDLPLIDRLVVDMFLFVVEM